MDLIQRLLAAIRIKQRFRKSSFVSQTLKSNFPFGTPRGLFETSFKTEGKKQTQKFYFPKKPNPSYLRRKSVGAQILHVDPMMTKDTINAYIYQHLPNLISLVESRQPMQLSKTPFYRCLVGISICIRRYTIRKVHIALKYRFTSTA